MAVINVLVLLMRYGRLSKEGEEEKNKKNTARRETARWKDQRQEQMAGGENYVSTLPALETDLFSLKPQL